LLGKFPSRVGTVRGKAVSAGSSLVELLLKALGFKARKKQLITIIHSTLLLGASTDPEC
jgi:hypothetical protein